jgi:hypothetical protein
VDVRPSGRLVAEPGRAVRRQRCLQTSAGDTALRAPWIDQRTLGACRIWLAAMGPRSRKRLFSRAGRFATGALLAVSAASAAAPATARPLASTAAACSITGKQENQGPTYLTSLSVSGGANCATGLSVVRAYYRCRVHAGGVKGYCHSSVLGFRCSEKRTGISIQFDSRVTCARGRQRVYHTYTQDT